MPDEWEQAPPARPGVRSTAARACQSRPGGWRRRKHGCLAPSRVRTAAVRVCQSSPGGQRRRKH
eukprot:362824-Chlamydomonas_euryale.AAC.6